MQPDDLMIMLGGMREQLATIARQNTEQAHSNTSQTAALAEIRAIQAAQLTSQAHIKAQLTMLAEKQDKTDGRVRNLEVGAARYGAVAGTLAGIGTVLLSESVRWFARIKGG